MMNNKELCVPFLVLPAVVGVTLLLGRNQFYCGLVLLEKVFTALIGQELEGV